VLGGKLTELAKCNLANGGILEDGTEICTVMHGCDQEMSLSLNATNEILSGMQSGNCSWCNLAV